MKSVRKRIREAKEALEKMRFEDGKQNPFHGKRGGRPSRVHKSPKVYSRKAKHKKEW